MYIGIDGCKTGWIIAQIKDVDSQPIITLNVFKSLEDFTQAIDFKKITSIWIDIPIGLSQQSERLCDLLLRIALGKKASSAFVTPVRNAVFTESYQHACDENYKNVGKKISLQSWHICPKIKEIDNFLQHHPEFVFKMKESHPELIFKLNSSEEFESKKTTLGFEQRLNFLESKLYCSAQVNQFIKQFPRSKFAKDDVTDALILALSAYSSQKFGETYLGDNQFKIHLPNCL
jgi:predicted RNase H-like nuclease